LRSDKFFSIGNQGIIGNFTLREGTDAKPIGDLGRHVFQAVNRQVDAAVQKGFLDLFHKQALAAHFGQGNVEDFISLGFDDFQPHRDIRKPGFQFRLDPVGLPQGQSAAAGADDYVGAHQWPQPAQLEAAQPPQEEPAEADTVSPLAPLLRNPQVDMRRHTFSLLQEGHWEGSSPPKTRYSNS
jgi:hypothetical protein